MCTVRCRKHVNIPSFAIFSPIHDEPIKFAFCTQEATPEKMVMHDQPWLAWNGVLKSGLTLVRSWACVGQHAVKYSNHHLVMSGNIW